MIKRALWRPLESQAAFEHGGRLETDRLRGGDGHGFSRFRVASLASGAFFHFEGAKTNDLDFRVFLYAVGDGRKHGFECLIGRTLGGVFTEGDLDGINQFSFVHGNDVCANVIPGWQEKIRSKKSEFFREGR